MRALKRYYAAAAVGAAAALPVELALLLWGGGLFEREPLGDVFDAQARSLLDGRWDVPDDVIKIEGFVVDGRTYTYFGPFPAVLRMPVVALTDSLDGRLTRVSLLVAWAITLVFAARLARRARAVVAAGAGDPGRAELALVALWTFVLGAGSSVTYLTSRPSVFHEAIAWGVATALVAFDALLGWRARPSLPRLALATALAMAALLTRPSVGAGPIAALAGFAALALVRREGARRAGAAALAVVVPVAAYMAVNVAKFESLVGVPFGRHRVTMVDEHRRDVLAANRGTIQGPQFLPTTSLQYVRPDALGFDHAFPWVDFPRRAVVVGGVVMDQVDVASSVPSAMPAATAVAVAGGVALWRGRRRLGLDWAPVAGGAAACLVVTLAIGFVAHRYTADAVPLLVVLGAVAAASRWRRVTLAALAVLALVSVAVTVGLTIQFQQHYGFLTEASARARLARTQIALPGGRPHYVAVGVDDPLPALAPDRTFAVVGDCAALYRSDGTTWQPVERTAAAGRLRLRLAPPARWRGPDELVAGVSVERAGGGLVLRHRDRTSWRVPGAPGAAVVLDVVLDRRLGFLEVRHRGDLVLDDFTAADAAPVVAPTFPGGVEELPTPAPVCERVRRDGQPAGRRS